MDWKRAIEDERAALGRIVALLCALADLAERASGRSAIVRSLVLWFLLHAEMVARDFVMGDPDAPSATMPTMPAGAGPADAVRLAISLRALARQLDNQARLLAAPWRRDGGEPEASPAARIQARSDAIASLSRLTVFALGVLPPAPDTS